MKSVFRIEEFDIELKQSKSGKILQVIYGRQLDVTRSYSEACSLLGQAILHASACTGNLDNESIGD